MGDERIFEKAALMATYWKSLIWVRSILLDSTFEDGGGGGGLNTLRQLFVRTTRMVMVIGEPLVIHFKSCLDLFFVPYPILFLSLTLIRMTKDEMVLAFSKAYCSKMSKVSKN